MVKKKVKSEEELKNMVLPVANDVLCIAVRLLGFDKVFVKCPDGHERLCRIRGKMKRRVWIRGGAWFLFPHGTSNLAIEAKLYGDTRGVRPTGPDKRIHHHLVRVWCLLKKSGENL